MIILDEQYNDIQGLGFRKLLKVAKSVKQVVRKAPVARLAKVVKKAAPKKASFLKRAVTKVKTAVRKKVVGAPKVAVAPRANFFTRAVRTVGGGIAELKTLIPAPAQENFSPTELAEFQDAPIASATASAPVGQLTPVAPVATSTTVVATAVMPSNPTPAVVAKAENTATMEQIATASIEPVGEIKAVVAVAPPRTITPPKPPASARKIAPEAVLDEETAQEAIGDLTPVTAVAPASQEMRTAIMQKVANETENTASVAPQPKNNTLMYAGLGVAVIAAVVLMNKKK